MDTQARYPIAYRLPPAALAEAARREYRLVVTRGGREAAWRTDAGNLFRGLAGGMVGTPGECCPLGVACLVALGERLEEFLVVDAEHAPLGGSVGLPDGPDVLRVLEFLGLAPDAPDDLRVAEEAAAFIEDFDAGRIEPGEPLRAALGVRD
jgi:hypothetical protein